MQWVRRNFSKPKQSTFSQNTSVLLLLLHVQGQVCGPTHYWYFFSPGMAKKYVHSCAISIDLCFTFQRTFQDRHVSIRQAVVSSVHSQAEVITAHCLVNAPSIVVIPDYVTQVWSLSQFFLFPFCEKSFICLVGKSMTPFRGDTILFRSSQQLPHLRLRPLEGFLS